MGRMATKGMASVDDAKGQGHCRGRSSYWRVWIWEVYLKLGRESSLFTLPTYSTSKLTKSNMQGG